MRQLSPCNLSTFSLMCIVLNDHLVFWCKCTMSKFRKFFIISLWKVIELLLLEAAAVSEDLVLPKNTIGCIKSIHHDYINLQSKDGIVTLVRSGLDHIPFGVEVDLEGSWLDFGLKQQQIIQCHANAIVLGDTLAVQGLQTCFRFSCKASLKPGAKDFLSQLRQLQDLCNSNTDKDGIMAYLGHCDAEEVFQGKGLLEGKIPRKVHALITGVVEGRESLIRDGICGLLGVGPGSTPAGDDFLLGFFSAVSHIQPQNCRYAVQKMIHHLQWNAPSLTTFMSVEYLKYGIKALYHQRIGEMIFAFGSSTIQEVIGKAKKVMQLGHSSGADFLAGFVYGGFTALFAGNPSEEKGVDK